MGERVGASSEGHGLAEHQLADLRHSIEMLGVDSLEVSDLSAHDVARIDWSSATHLKYVRRAIDRVPSGEVEYLAIKGRDGTPIAKGGIDFAKRVDGAELWQLATPTTSGTRTGNKVDGRGRGPYP